MAILDMPDLRYRYNSNYSMFISVYSCPSTFPSIDPFDQGCQKLYQSINIGQIYCIVASNTLEILCASRRLIYLT